MENTDTAGAYNNMTVKINVNIDDFDQTAEYNDEQKSECAESYKSIVTEQITKNYPGADVVFYAPEQYGCPIDCFAIDGLPDDTEQDLVDGADIEDGISDIISLIWTTGLFWV